MAGVSGEVYRGDILWDGGGGVGRGGQGGDRAGGFLVKVAAQGMTSLCLHTAMLQSL